MIVIKTRFFVQEVVYNLSNDARNFKLASRAPFLSNCRELSCRKNLILMKKNSEVSDQFYKQ